MATGPVRDTRPSYVTDWPEAPFGQVLQGLRVRRRLEVAELAQRVGVVPATILNYERGHSYPGLPVFYRLVLALGVGRDAVRRLVVSAGWGAGAGAGVA